MDPVVWPSLEFSGQAAVEAALSAAEDLSPHPGALKILAGITCTGPTEARQPRNETTLFLQDWSPEIRARLSGITGCILILPDGAEPSGLEVDNAVFFSRNPKYAYAKLMTALFPLARQRGGIETEPFPGVRAALGFALEDGVILEPFVTIGRDSTIGKGSYLMKGAVIGPRVRIGEDCVIGEGAVIGSPGFGFAFDRGKPPLRLPQLGGVRIGDRVEIGTLSCVDAGTMSPTEVENDVKMNSHVHIAHNCRIGCGTVLGAVVSVSGSSIIGERCWLGPGSVVRNKISVGGGATIGMGAVVVKNVPAGWTVVGIPAKPTGSTVPWYESEKGTP